MCVDLLLEALLERLRRVFQGLVVVRDLGKAGLKLPLLWAATLVLLDALQQRLEQSSVVRDIESTRKESGQFIDGSNVHAGTCELGECASPQWKDGGRVWENCRGKAVGTLGTKGSLDSRI